MYANLATATPLLPLETMVEEHVNMMQIAAKEFDGTINYFREVANVCITLLAENIDERECSTLRLMRDILVLEFSFSKRMQRFRTAKALELGYSIDAFIFTASTVENLANQMFPSIKPLNSHLVAEMQNGADLVAGKGINIIKQFMRSWLELKLKAGSLLRRYKEDRASFQLLLDQKLNALASFISNSTGEKSPAVVETTTAPPVWH